MCSSDLSATATSHVHQAEYDADKGTDENDDDEDDGAVRCAGRVVGCFAVL